MAVVAPLLSGPGVAVFALLLITALQGFLAHRDRAPGMPAFALASALAAVACVLSATDALPDVVPFAVLGFAHTAWVVGLLQHVAWPTRRRTAAALALLAPWPVALAALASGAASVAAAFGPALWTTAGAMLVALGARRRDPGAGHALLAAGQLVAAGVWCAAWATTLQAPAERGACTAAAAIAAALGTLVANQLRKDKDMRAMQAHALRMSNYYKTLSETNQAVLHVHDADVLYQAVCDICVRTGHAQMACLYVLKDGLASREITAGPAARVLAGIPQAWDPEDPAYHDSYTACALRDGVRLVSNDYLHDPRTASWHGLAAEHQIRAMVWLPFRRATRVDAVLMLSATERDYFDEPLLQLLDQMSRDISFALDHLDGERQRIESAKEVEAALERFSTLFQAAPVPAAIVAIHGRVLLDVNQAVCERDGLPREALVGRSTAELEYGVVPEDREAFYALFRQEGRVRNFLARSTSRLGQNRRVLVNAEPIDYLEQPCLLILALDITELQEAEDARRAQAAAEAANRAKTHFLSHMSHELRTPLNAILGFSALLRQDAAPRLTAPERVQLDHVQQAGWYLLKLINDVLDLARIEAGQFKVEPAPLALALLIDEVFEMSRPLAAQHQVTLHADHRTAPQATVLADATRLRQVLLNVVGNAIKYNRPGGAVHVRIDTRDAAPTAIEVSDSGLGMTPQQLAELFQPFNRLGREREGIEGTGIGLALSRQLMALMGGAIAVDSTPGVGTQVRLQVPRAEADTRTTAPRVADMPEPANRAAPSGTVLYIEDNPVNTLLMQNLFARWPDVLLHVAEDGRTGLARASALSPDLVLLDLQLPDLAGLDVLRALRATPALRDRPVIVLSANAMPEDVSAAMAEGATDYWTKPIEFGRFLAAVGDLLRVRATVG